MDFQSLSELVQARVVRKSCWDYRQGKNVSGHQFVRAPALKKHAEHAIAISPIFGSAVEVQQFVTDNSAIYQEFASRLKGIRDCQGNGYTITGYADDWETGNLMLSLMWPHGLPLWEVRGQVTRYLIKHYDRGMDIFFIERAENGGAFSICHLINRGDNFEGPLRISTAKSEDLLDDAWCELKNIPHDTETTQGYPCIGMTEILMSGWHLTGNIKKACNIFQQ